MLPNARGDAGLYADLYLSRFRNPVFLKPINERIQMNPEFIPHPE
jgi:hypothetical protein